MGFSQIISAILAGGFAGQLTTLILSNRFSERRELTNWLRDEKFKVFSELLSLASSSEPREDYDQWPTEIQALCQKVILLCKNGSPPQSLSDSMEKVFQNAWLKKQGKIEDQSKWVEEMRIDVRILREELAKVLHSPDYSLKTKRLNEVINQYLCSILNLKK